MAAGFYDLFNQLQGSGVYEFLLPFLLIFTVIFGILEKTKLFGTDTGGKSRKNINAVIALVLGLLVTSQFEVIQQLNSFLPRMSMFIIIAMMVLIFVGLFTGEMKGWQGYMIVIILIVALIATYWAMAPSLGFYVPYWIEENWDTVAIALIIGLILYSVINGGGASKDEDEKDKQRLRLNKIFGVGGSDTE